MMINTVMANAGIAGITPQPGASSTINRNNANTLIRSPTTDSVLLSPAAMKAFRDNRSAGPGHSVSLVSQLTPTDVSLVQAATGYNINLKSQQITDSTNTPTTTLPALATAIANTRMLHNVSGTISTTNLSQVTNLANQMNLDLSSDVLARATAYLQQPKS